MPSSTIVQTIIAADLVTANLVIIIAAQWGLVANHCSAIVPKDIDYIICHYWINNSCSASSAKAEMNVMNDDVQSNQIRREVAQLSSLVPNHRILNV